MRQTIRAVDMHCDTISALYEKQFGEGTGPGRETGNPGTAIPGSDMTIRTYPGHLNLEKMKAGGYGLQNFALFVDLMERKDPLDYGMRLVDGFYREMERYPEEIGVVTSWEEIEHNWEAGRMSALLTLEEGGVCKGSLSHLRNFYRMGVRMMTLTWNYPNELAYPNRIIWEGPQRGQCVPETERGLTETGFSFIEEMERLGMIIDLSHLGDAGIWDVLSHTKRPLVASHSNARAVAGHPRNLTDEMVRALSERGGVAGINYCAAFLRDWEREEDEASLLDDMVRHARHLYQVGGIGCIGLGSDFDGIHCRLEMGDGAGLQRLAEALEKGGFSTGEVEAIFHGNVLRVYREVL